MNEEVIIKLECLARRYSKNSEQRKTFFIRFQDKLLDEYIFYRNRKIKETRALEIALENTEYEITKEFERLNPTNYLIDTYIWLKDYGFNKKESERRAKTLTEHYFKIIAKKIIWDKLDE